jgi:N-methylhydantoinase B
VLATTIAGAHIAFRHVFPEIPINQGCFRPFHFQIPTTTFLNAQHPRPVAGCASEVCQRVIDVVLGALGQAIPEQTYAAPMGTVTNLAVGGDDPRKGYYVFYSFIGGGYGGNSRADRLINGNPAIALARTQALEIFEFSYSVLFRQYAIRDESGGAGRSRGGLGVVLEFEIRRGEARASILGERGCFAPFGLLGGKPAQMAQHTFVLEGQPYQPPHVTKDEGVFMQAGDVLRLETPGGGGYGTPLERPVESVWQDVRREYYSQATAEREYGVILDDETLEIDEEVTARLREQLARMYQHG